MKFMIVDDDSLVRIALKSAINWANYGYDLVGEASNGQEALQLIDKYQPDLLIMDIRMPVLDGIGVLRELAPRPVKPAVIIVSSHNDFELVKEAIKLGAEDYLLKMDINFDNLLAIMARVAEKMAQELDAKKAESHKERFISQQLFLMRKEFYRNAITRFYISDKDLEEAIDMLNIPINARQQICLIVLIESKPSRKAKEKQQVINFALINIIEEILGDQLDCTCFEFSSGEIYAVAAPRGDQVFDKPQLRELGERLIEIINDYLNIKVNIAIGVGGSGLKGVQEASDKAEQAVLKKYFKGSESIFFGDEVLDHEPAKTEFNIFPYKETLMNGLITHDVQEITRIFDQIAQEIDRKGVSRESIRTAMTFLYYLICEYLNNAGVEPQQVLASSESAFEELIQTTNPAAARSLIERLKQDMLGFIRQYVGIISDSLQKSRAYIQKHFAENISLQDVANHVNMNPSYLSNLMKKRIGMNYSEYIIYLRIQKAKELIGSSDEKLYRIAEIVGYPNVFYFSRLFKRETGLTPGDYRKNFRDGKGFGTLL